MQELKAVDFFCGGGGMSFGMQKAGIQVIAGIDFDSSCQKTYEANIKGARFLHEDINILKEKVLADTLSLKQNDNELILIGCSPCQFWSIIQTDKKKSEKSKSLLIEFRRFVEYFNPGYVVVENVPGILRKKEDSGLASFMTWLTEHGYCLYYKVVNTNQYGVPQNRKRFTLIANRVTNQPIEPIKSSKKSPVVRQFIGEHNGFPKVKTGHIDQTDFMHTVANLSKVNLERLKLIPPDGGNRLSFAHRPDLQLPCFKGKDEVFKDTFGRLWWDKPSSTITTKFFSISNGRFVHPEENRALSLREGAVLQTFPKSYKFIGTSKAAIARIIGNAVPPLYAKSIGKAIIENHSQWESLKQEQEP